MKRLPSLWTNVLWKPCAKQSKSSSRPIPNSRSRWRATIILKSNPTCIYLSIPYGHKFPENVKAERERKGQISTVYTCCSEAFPNTFTFSDPAEATWTALHAIAGGYDGYLRWAVNSWTADPLRDSRFRTWAAGDTYSIYPGPRSSIRFERLVEGIQDCEKIRILREELAAKGAKGKLNKLNKAVAKFTPEGLSETQQSAAEMVNELNKLLNSL